MRRALAGVPFAGYHGHMQVARALQSHIDETAGRPVVAGTDIKVGQIAWECEYHGMTPDDIVEAHPHLTLADVHAALAYFYDHRDAMVAEWQERDRLIEAMQTEFPAPPLRPRHRAQ